MRGSVPMKHPPVARVFPLLFLHHSHSGWHVRALRSDLHTHEIPLRAPASVFLVLYDGGYHYLLTQEQSQHPRVKPFVHRHAL